MNCPTCSELMKPLFSSMFCPKECDRPGAKPVNAGKIILTWSALCYNYTVYGLPPDKADPKFVSFWWVMKDDDIEYCKKAVKANFPYFHKNDDYLSPTWYSGNIAALVVTLR